MIDRMERVQKALKNEISRILEEEINDPRVRHVTITKVEVTRDLRLAKVFCMITAEAKEKKDILKGLKSASKFIRGEISSTISMKFTPEISFREDKLEERNESIDRIFEIIEKEEKEKSGH